MRVRRAMILVVLAVLVADAMAFVPGAQAASAPFVVTSVAGTSGALGPTYQLSIPSPTTRGDLLIIIITTAPSPATTVTFPVNWSLEVKYSESATSIVAAYHVSNGSMASTIPVTFAGNAYPSWTTYRIQGWMGLTAASTNGGTSQYPAPPYFNALTTNNYLWIVGASLSGGAGCTAPPVNFQGLLTISNGNPGSMCTAYEYLQAANLQPASFTATASTTWVTTTFAIYPSAPIGGNPPTLDTNAMIFILFLVCVFGLGLAGFGLEQPVLVIFAGISGFGFMTWFLVTTGFGVLTVILLGISTFFLIGGALFAIGEAS